LSAVGECDRLLGDQGKEPPTGRFRCSGRHDPRRTGPADAPHVPLVRGQESRPGVQGAGGNYLKRTARRTPPRQAVSPSTQATAPWCVKKINRTFPIPAPPPLPRTGGEGKRSTDPLPFGGEGKGRGGGETATMPMILAIPHRPTPVRPAPDRDFHYPNGSFYWPSLLFKPRMSRHSSAWP